MKKRGGRESWHSMCRGELAYAKGSDAKEKGSDAKEKGSAEPELNELVDLDSSFDMNEPFELPFPPPEESALLEHLLSRVSRGDEAGTSGSCMNDLNSSDTEDKKVFLPTPFPLPTLPTPYANSP